MDLQTRNPLLMPSKWSIKNAFNTLKWDRILRKLETREVPGPYLKLMNDYFSDREIYIENEEGRLTTTMQIGVPQGSVLGPLMWNVVYDDLLKSKVPDDTKIIAFADDLLIINQHKNLEILKETTEKAIGTVNS